MTIAPVFPPLFRGMAAGPANPLTIAMAEAERGVDAGLLVWSQTEERLRAALVLAPDTDLDAAMVGLVACAVGAQNALGVLAPPETGVQIDWAGDLRMNGAHLGALTAHAATRDPARVPDWLIVGLDLTLRLPDALEPGQIPHWTALDQEGCGDIDPVALLEAWARHSLNWLHAIEAPEGRAALYREWRGLVWNLGGPVSLHLAGDRHEGQFLGVDENFGMILKSTDGDTRLVPLSSILDEI